MVPDFAEKSSKDLERSVNKKLSLVSQLKAKAEAYQEAKQSQKLHSDADDAANHEQGSDVAAMKQDITKHMLRLKEFSDGEVASDDETRASVPAEARTHSNNAEAQPQPSEDLLGLSALERHAETMTGSNLLKGELLAMPAIYH